MFRIRALILINAITFFTLFAIGLIHPYVVLTFEFLMPFVGILIILIFIISVVKFTVKFIQNLFKPEKKILTNLYKIVLGLVLAYIFVCLLSLSHYISFAGLCAHYGYVKDYDTIRIWADNVEIPDGGLLYMNGFDIPEPARPFHPENVEVREEEGIRRLWLSWDSGFMQVGWELIICPPDEVYQLQSGMLAKIQPGVYLHYEFYSH